MKQTFKLFKHGQVHPVDVVIDDNFSFMTPKDVQDKWTEYIKKYNLDSHGRYVAMGNAGDCVIYDNGVIDQMSDSG